MSIHESLPQHHQEALPPPIDQQQFMADYNSDISEGIVPSYDTLATAHELSLTLDDTVANKMFAKNSDPDRWALSEERHAENFRITRARSLDELTPQQIKNAAVLVKAKHAAPETHLEEIQKQAEARLSLSEKIYEQRAEEQPMTSWVQRQLKNEAQGITREARLEQEHKNSREKTRTAFVAKFTPKLINHMFSEDYVAGVENTSYPVKKEDYEAVGIGDGEELISRAVAFEFNKIVADFDQPEATAVVEPEVEPVKAVEDDPVEVAEVIEVDNSADDVAGTRVKATQAPDKPKIPVAFQTYKLTVPDIQARVDEILAARGGKTKKPTEPVKVTPSNPDNFEQYLQHISQRGDKRDGQIHDAPEKAKFKLHKKAIKYAGALAVATVAGILVHKYGFNPLEHMQDGNTVNDMVPPASPIYGSDLPDSIQR